MWETALDDKQGQTSRFCPRCVRCVTGWATKHATTAHDQILHSQNSKPHEIKQDDEQEEVMLAGYWKINIETKSSSISAVHLTMCVTLCVHLQSTCLLIGPFHVTVHRQRAQPSSEYLITNVVYFRCSISNQGVHDRLLSRSRRVKPLLKHYHTTGQSGVIWR